MTPKKTAKATLKEKKLARFISGRLKELYQSSFYRMADGLEITIVELDHIANS